LYPKPAQEAKSGKNRICLQHSVGNAVGKLNALWRTTDRWQFAAWLSERVRTARSSVRRLFSGGLDQIRAMIISGRVEKALIELQRAVTPEDVWRACSRLMRAALPVSHVLIGLPSLGLTPFFVRTTLAVRDTEHYFARLSELAPLNDVVARQPGIKVTRLSDHFIPRPGDPFFDEFMQPAGWLYSAAMLFWTAEGIFIGQLSITRSAAQGDITVAEMEMLRCLHPHVNAAVERLLALDRARAANKSLEHFVGALPLGMAGVDWELKLSFTNPAAREAICLWRHGRKAARALKPELELPAELRAACQRLKTNWTSALAADDFDNLERSITLHHPEMPGFQATAEISEPAGGRGLQPSFTIIFLLPAAEHNEVRRAFTELSKLTASEKGVARLAGAGYDNASIACELGISQSTVRTHLRNVFRKLGITTRAKLSPLHQQLGGGMHAPQHDGFSEERVNIVQTDDMRQPRSLL
jgi:DNA-binding CsgD family transcriptional regulator